MQCWSEGLGSDLPPLTSSTVRLVILYLPDLFTVINYFLIPRLHWRCAER